MRGMKGEIVLNIPAEKAWEMYRDNDKISRVNPQMLSKAEYIQGEGEPGTLRRLQLGPALSSYVKQSVEKIEKVEEGRSVTYQVTDGDLRKMYNPYRVTFSFIPVRGSNKQCVAEWKAEYEPITPTIPAPEKARDAALSFLKLIDKM
ncbi:major strawberry allergen Fra a 1-B-like [Lycium ferocissimum]|uniref:major strawberry allergen Fra a 1-B-like n=1 Tax=Lycium ferocissimum TaxID=112874 RepID=UPI0028157BEF|nr:major strawberry allergen Fra a 1-B-like [Lycium ferocissimum]